MARFGSTCLLAGGLIFLFVTFFAFFDGLPRSTAVGGGSAIRPDLPDILHGAIPQQPAKAQPPPVRVEDPPMKNDDEEKKEEEKKKEEKKPDPPKPKPTIRPTFEVGDFEHSPDGPKPSEIVLLAASDGKGHNGGIVGLLDMAKKNRQDYADLQGYKFEFINITKYDIGKAHPVWAKIPAIIDTFNMHPSAKWVWWLDLDAIIMTPSINLNDHLLSHRGLLSRLQKGEEILAGGQRKTGLFTSKDPNPANIDLIVSQDHNGLNAGSFFLRRSEFTRWLLDIWYDPFFVEKDWPGKEQDAILHLVENHRIVREHTGYVPQRVLNAYSVGGDHMGWKTGDLVVHFAGCWVENKCDERWKDFWGRRVLAKDSKKTSTE